MIDILKAIIERGGGEAMAAIRAAEAAGVAAGTPEAAGMASGSLLSPDAAGGLVERAEQ